MTDEILFLHSPLKEKIYGGKRIPEMFEFKTSMGKKIGEYWAISAHENGMSIVENGPYKGQSLKEVFENHRELFHNVQDERFPLLVKINEITKPVSVQVHPADVYAKEHEHDLGKAEFCLFLDVKEGTKLVRGHTANTKAEFEKLAEEQKWDQLLCRKSVSTDDYVYTPAGVVHGVEGKLLMAEVQQSSDVTYRIYDYDNVDIDGKPRELHLKKALDVITIPHKEPQIHVQKEENGNNQIIRYISNEFFRITRYRISDVEKIKNEMYSLGLVLKGNGTIQIDNEIYTLTAGQAFILTSGCTVCQISGYIDILMSEPGQVLDGGKYV